MSTLANSKDKDEMLHTTTFTIYAQFAKIKKTSSGTEVNLNLEKLTYSPHDLHNEPSQSRCIKSIEIIYSYTWVKNLKKGVV